MALIGTIAFIIAGIAVAAGLAIRAYLARDKPAHVSQNGIDIYSESAKPIDYYQFDLITESYIQHMEKFWDMQTMRDHIRRMACTFTATQIPRRPGYSDTTYHNGVCHSPYNISVYHLSVDIAKTAFAYELHNAVIWAFCGYDVAIDEGGASRFKYDDWFRKEFS